MKPVSPLRQVRLVLGLGVRRWINRVSGGLAAIRLARGGRATVLRPPTASLRGRMGFVLFVLMLAVLFQVVFSIWQFADRAVAVAENRPPVHARILTTAMEWHRDKTSQDDIRKMLATDPAVKDLPSAERERVLDDAIRWLEHALASNDISNLKNCSPETRLRIAALVATLLGLIALFVIASDLSISNKDLARPDWDELWLAAQPVSDRMLFTARLVQYTVINPLVWLLIPAAVAVLAGRFGLGWPAAVALGLGAGLAWAVSFAALRLLTETWLRQNLAHARIKNLQALLTVIGMATMVAGYAVMMTQQPHLPDWFLFCSEALPWSALPTGWAAQAALLPGQAMLWLLLGLVFAAAVAFATVLLCARWSRGGLIVHGGTMSGRRGGAKSAWQSMRVLGKDLLLLRRDRSLLVQALVMPPFLIALQLVVHPDLGRAALSGFHNATTFVVALGGWVLMSATMALAFEGQALWILAGAPMPLAQAIRGKVAMWAGFATGYAVLGLAAITIFLPWTGASAITDMTMILLGMPLLAALAVGIGAAATDPQATEQNRRVGFGAIYLYMMVMALLSLTVNRGDTHQRLAMLIVLAMIAWALWQRLHDRLTYIFEPVDRPPRQVDLADGAWAAFSFLVMQGIVAGIMLACDCPLPQAILISFGTAGGLTALGALLILWRAQVPDLLRAVGIRPPPGTSLRRTVTIGCASGLVAVLLALAYLATLAALAPHLPMLAQALDTARQHPELSGGWHMVVLMVVLAPLCEEFIFRGLLFRGLRRDLSPVWAALASAAVFAIIHPSLGVLPVFGLGVACALAYERTGWLLAPILAHALYNGVLVLQSA